MVSMVWADGSGMKERKLAPFSAPQNEPKDAVRHNDKLIVRHDWAVSRPSLDLLQGSRNDGNRWGILRGRVGQQSVDVFGALVVVDV